LFKLHTERQKKIPKKEKQCGKQSVTFTLPLPTFFSNLITREKKNNEENSERKRDTISNPSPFPFVLRI